MEDLIIKAKGGDNEAIETIINKYMPLIISEATKYHIPGYEVDDIVQHDILSLIKAIKFYKVGAKSFATYISKTIRNNNKNLLKGTIKHNREVQDEKIQDKCIDQYGFTLEDEVIAHDKARILNKVLEKIPYQDRKVLLDFYIKRKKIKEIAEEYGILEKEVIAMKKKSIKKLERFMKVVYIDED